MKKGSKKLPVVSKIPTIISEVKKGRSFYSLAKEYNVSTSTIKDWCNKAGVKSSFVFPERKKKDSEIIDLIKKNKVMTQANIGLIFGYSPSVLTARLLALTREGKINFVRLADTKLFPDHANRRIYYIDKEDLQQWILKRIPKGMPLNLRRAMAHKLRDIVQLPYTDAQNKTIAVRKEIYDKLKEEANKKNMHISTIVDNVLRTHFRRKK